MSADVELFSDGIRRRERDRRRRGMLWSFASFAGHCAFFAAVVLLTPARSLVLPEPKERANPAADLSADRIEEIAGSLADARIAELLRQVEAMQSVLHNMDAMKEALSADYDRFAEKSAEDVRGELERLVAEAESNQRRASEAQSAVKSEVSAIAAVETGGGLAKKEVSEDLHRRADALREGSVEKANTAQANAVNALDRLQVKAEFAGYRKTSEAAERMRDAQMEAGRMQDEAQTEAVDVAITLVEVASNDAFVERGRSEVAEARRRLEEAGNAKPDADRRIADEERQMKAAEAVRAAARSEKRWEDAKTAQRDADRHRRAMEEAKRESRTAQRAINDANSRIRHWDQRLPKALERQEQLRKVAAERAGDRQVERLGRAEESQRRVNEGIAALKAVLAADVPELRKLAKGEERREDPLVAEDASRMTMTDAYELARRLESAITESYKDIKSAQTAIARRMSFDAAQRITDVARPERAAADAEAIESKPRTKEELDRQKVAQRRVVDEAGAMAESAIAMMEEAMAIVMPGADSADARAESRNRPVRRLDEKDFESRDVEPVEERVAAMDAAADYQVAIESAAAEDSGMKAKDLSKLMARSGDTAAAEAEGGGPAQEGAPVPPALSSDDAGLLPGNVMSVAGGYRGGIAAKWMYVNSWYVIGPFPNPNRVNLRRKFAPESVVDLDATYVGKDGKTLRWRFCQAKSSRPPEPWMADWRAEVVPEGGEEYAIYYAYAEVFMDRECDRWVAIGSDDRSDVWLNDFPIWGSSNRLKQWSLAEDFRRVHFRKGRNRILVRIENGHWKLGWSVCISTGDSRDGI